MGVGPVDELNLVLVDSAGVNCGHHLDEDGQEIALEAVVAIRVYLQTPLRSLALLSGTEDRASVLFLLRKVADHKLALEEWRNDLFKHSLRLRIGLGQFDFQLPLDLLNQFFIQSESPGLFGFLCLYVELFFQLIEGGNNLIVLVH